MADWSDRRPARASLLWALLPAVFLLAGCAHPRPSSVTPVSAARPPAAATGGTALEAVKTAVVQPIEFTIGGKRLTLERHLGDIAGYFAARPFDPYVEAALGRGNVEQGRAIVSDSRYAFASFEPVTLPRDLTWVEDPFQNRTWAWGLHGLVFLPSVVAYHRATGDPNALEFLLKTVADWMHDNAQVTSPSAMSWHDQATAIRLQNILGLFTYTLDERISETERGLLLRAIYVHAEVLMRDDFYSKFTNHGFEQALALAWTGLALPEFARAADWREIGTKRLRDECRYGFTEEGVHKENSPSYHFLFISRVLKAEAMLRAYGESEADFDPVLAKAYRYAQYVALPDGYLPLMGDTSLSDRPVMSWQEDFPGRQEALYSLTQGLEGTKPAAADAVFPKSGYAIFRDRWHDPGDFDQTVFFMMKMASLATYHQHNDILSFWLYGLGENWIVDSGLYKYAEADPSRIYVRSRRGHNVVLVDGEESESIPHWMVAPSTYEEGHGGEKVAYCRASYQPTPNVRHTREVLFVKPDMFLIRDTLKSLDGSPHRYLQVFHVDRDKTLARTERAFVVRSKGNPRLTLTITSVTPGLVSLYQVQGQQIPFVQGWSAYERFAISPTAAVGFQKQATDHTFSTAVELHRAGEPEGRAQVRNLETFNRAWMAALPRAR